MLEACAAGSKRQRIRNTCSMGTRSSGCSGHACRCQRGTQVPGLPRCCQQLVGWSVLPLNAFGTCKEHAATSVSSAAARLHMPVPTRPLLQLASKPSAV
jgi:hypothetical protein